MAGLEGTAALLPRCTRQRAAGARAAIPVPQGRYTGKMCRRVRLQLGEPDNREAAEHPGLRQEILLGAVLGEDRRRDRDEPKSILQHEIKRTAQVHYKQVLSVYNTPVLFILLCEELLRAAAGRHRRFEGTAGQLPDNVHIQVGVRAQERYGASNRATERVEIRAHHVASDKQNRRAGEEVQAEHEAIQHGQRPGPGHPAP